MILNFKNRLIIPVIAASAGLTLFSSFGYQNNAQAKPDFKDSLNKFSENLNVQMEDYLKDYLKRKKVGFTTTSKLEGNTAVVSAPSFIERETIFSLKVATDKNQENLDLSGTVLTKEQRDLIISLAHKNFPDYKIKDNLTFFPYKEINNGYAVVKKSYADLFVKPGDKELATQTLMGTPLRILELSPDKKFVRVQSADDKYISWISRQNILEMDSAKWNSWRSSRNSLVIKDLNSPEKLYFGTILPVVSPISVNPVKVRLPDGKTIAIPKNNIENLNKMASNVKQLVNTADGFLKFGKAGKSTYLWGGTVGKDLDCSGFNQTIFRSEGIFLPRDADQQQSFSTPVAPDLSRIDELKPGDLLFFSAKKQYATHTGIYIGNYKFIHSSSGGDYRGIKISTLKGGGVYDKKLQKMYFGAGRVDFKNMTSAINK